GTHRARRGRRGDHRLQPRHPVVDDRERRGEAALPALRRSEPALRPEQRPGGRSRPAGVRGLLPAPPRIRAGRGLWARPGPRPRATLAVTRAHWAARRGGVDRTFVSALAPCSVPTGARAQATVSSRWRVAALAAFAPLGCGRGRKSRLSIPWRLITPRPGWPARPAACA